MFYSSDRCVICVKKIKYVNQLSPVLTYYQVRIIDSLHAIKEAATRVKQYSQAIASIHVYGSLTSWLAWWIA